MVNVLLDPLATYVYQTMFTGEVLQEPYKVLSVIAPALVPFTHALPVERLMLVAVEQLVDWALKP